MITLHRVRNFFMITVLATIGMGFSASSVIGAQEPDVLTAGPVHEAFAETASFDPEPGIVVPKAPPSAIEEVPPDEKPEGDVQWISGYWAWDDDRDGFIWISGSGGFLPLAGNGSPDIGMKPTQDISGFPATG
jgi:hypothetical protein